MLRRIAALAVVTAGATFTGTAAAALEGTPSTVIPDGPGVSQAHVVAGDQGNALVLTTSAAGTAWRPSLDLTTGTWGALIPNGRPGSPVAAARMGSMAAVLTSGGNDLTLNRLTIGGLVMAGSHVLNRADHTAAEASLVASGGTSALAVYIERPQGGGITGDIRANQLTEIRGNIVQVPQTVAADITIEGTPAVAATPDGAAIIGYAARDGANGLRAKVVWRTSRFGQWSAPGDLGPIGSSTPQVAAGDDGRLAITWAGTDGRVRMRTASAAQGFSPTALVSGARINPIPVVSLGTGGTALALWYSGAAGNQRAEAVRVGAGAGIEPPRDLGPSGVDGPTEQDVVPIPDGGFAVAWTSPHGPGDPAADFGVVVARTHGAAWWTSAVDGVGDAHLEYRPRLAPLPGGDVLATWRRTPMAGPGANEVRAQVISAHLPIPPMQDGAGAPPIGAPAAPALPAPAAPPAPAPTKGN